MILKIHVLLVKISLLMNNSRSQEPADKAVNSNETRQLAIKSLLEKAPVGVDDKLTT